MVTCPSPISLLVYEIHTQRTWIPAGYSDVSTRCAALYYDNKVCLCMVGRKIRTQIISCRLDMIKLLKS